ncbi:hypothetical protein RHMOL_Rhmol03G0294300 [Rhododendron molle]|uniref:Uncharacterized protein n=1 Tax=Rhododendron molle TaxID=49168 RepID=A0ACC0PL46_RHOML|nr:hypothetical protein RHMOL_Rhmol03G0294300 [Rhododendron molle]
MLVHGLFTNQLPSQINTSPSASCPFVVLLPRLPLHFASPLHHRLHHRCLSQASLRHLLLDFSHYVHLQSVFNIHNTALLVPPSVVNIFLNQSNDVSMWHLAEVCEPNHAVAVMKKGSVLICAINGVFVYLILGILAISSLLLMELAIFLFSVFEGVCTGDFKY